MKNFFKLMLLSLLLLPLQGCSNDDEAMIPTVLPVEVTPNNISGIWKLKSWSGSSQTPVVYLELIRRDRKFKIYQHYDSMYPRLITGTFTLESDYYKGTIISGKYDYDSGFWNNDYIVTLYSNSMVLTVDGNSSEVQVYTRVSEIPAEIKDNASSPVEITE